MNVPAKDMHLPLGHQQRVPKRTKIPGSVIQDRYPARFADFPDGLAGDQDG